MAIAIRRNEKVVVVHYSDAVHVSVDTLKRFVPGLPDDEGACAEYLSTLKKSDLADLEAALQEYVESGGDTWDCSTPSHKNWTDGTWLSFTAAAGQQEDFVAEEDEDLDDLRSKARSLVGRFKKSEFARLQVPEGWIGFIVGRPGAPRLACAAREANWMRRIVVRRRGGVERVSISDELADEVLPMLLRRITPK